MSLKDIFVLFFAGGLGKIGIMIFVPVLFLGRLLWFLVLVSILNNVCFIVHCGLLDV